MRSAGLRLLLALTALACLAAPMPAQAQGEPAIPSFWDPNRRPTMPDMSAIRFIRFLTADDYPPFNFTTAGGALTGFNVELARAICEELQVSCTIQERRWDTLIPALDDNRGDALIASLAISRETRAKVDFTSPYFVMPGRFVTRTGQSPAAAATPEKMGAAKVGVVAGSAHESWLKQYFPKLELKAFATAEAQREALTKGELDAIFGDAVSLAVWLNGTSSGGCCGFFGGPFIDRDYFGEGVAIAVRRNNAALRAALDYALARLSERGVYSELYLKYFPIGPF